MSTATASAPSTTSHQSPGPSRGPASLLSCYRFEMTKLVSLWRIRVALPACLIAPAVFVAVASHSGSLPTDTVFGRWMHQSGWAGSLVTLAFCGSWALPLLVSLVSGDVFAVEDRLGTWRHLIVVVRSPRRIFVAKALASHTVVITTVLALAASSIAGGLLAVGHRALVGLTGQTLSPGEAAGRVLLAWACVLAPTLAFAGIGLLGSVLLGRSPMGLLLPAVLALTLDLAQLLPLPVSVRVSLPSDAFVAWRSLFTEPAQGRRLGLAIAVSLIWAVAATALAYAAFVRRDFADLAHDGAGRRALVTAAVPLAVLAGATVLVVSVTIQPSGSGVTRAKLQDSLAASFAHLYRLQTGELHRPAVTETELRTSARCDRGGSLVADSGPGNDWHCTLRWRLPGSTAVGVAAYQVDVTPDGRYVADGDGPKEVNGFFLLHTPTGDDTDPLWQIDGNLDLLHA